jgi:hypothetical protein
LDHFPAEQLLVVRTDELASDPERLVRKVAAFIGVKSVDQFDWRHRWEYESATRRADRRLLVTLRRSSWMGQIIDHQPPRAARLASRIMTRNVSDWPFLPSAATADELRHRLQPDLRGYATCPPLAAIEPWGLLAS